MFTKMNYDLTIKLHSLENNEIFDLTLHHNVKCRYDELAAKLAPFNMHFESDIDLYDQTNPKLVAKLLSDPDELICWLANNSNELD